MHSFQNVVCQTVFSRKKKHYIHQHITQDDWCALQPAAFCVNVVLLAEQVFRTVRPRHCSPYVCGQQGKYLGVALSCYERSVYYYDCVIESIHKAGLSASLSFPPLLCFHGS